MLRFHNPTSQEQNEWKEWLESRPEVVRKIAERFDPWSLYLYKPTLQHVSVYSFREEGTITMIVSSKYNTLNPDSKVFGIDPNDLEEIYPGAIYEISEKDKKD